jgi:peptide/nickel transport system permease protein
MAKTRPEGIIALVVILLMLIMGIFAEQLAPYGMNEVNLMDILQGPSAEHILGTDNLGRDILTNIIYGARISIIIGFSATAVMLFISVTIGALSALVGGKFDMLIQRFVDAWMCIPSMIVLLMAMSLVGTGTVQIIFAIGITLGINSSRVIRSAAISVRANKYIESATILGASLFRILLRHIIPNIAPILIINAATQVGQVILLESSMSFLGMGVPPGVPSWGSMLSQEGRAYMEINPALAFWPGLALTLTVFASNIFGDALRDLLDPRLKGGVGSYCEPKDKKLKNLKQFKKWES